ncbi:hypothetical protein AB0J83_28000 [Actinoplanes sp. NPDC049596]|uniref:hypothetical protein n=1 Tax=unclassified Actinoplanes TaxID=2626549 RepID=UPI0034346A26
MATSVASLWTGSTEHAGAAGHHRGGDRDRRRCLCRGPEVQARYAARHRDHGGGRAGHGGLPASAAHPAALFDGQVRHREGVGAGVVADRLVEVLPQIRVHLFVLAVGCALCR